MHQLKNIHCTVASDASTVSIHLEFDDGESQKIAMPYDFLVQVLNVLNQAEFDARAIRSHITGSQIEPSAVGPIPATAVHIASKRERPHPKMLLSLLSQHRRFDFELDLQSIRTLAQASVALLQWAARSESDRAN